MYNIFNSISNNRYEYDYNPTWLWLFDAMAKSIMLPNSLLPVCEQDNRMGYVLYGKIIRLGI